MSQDNGIGTVWTPLSSTGFESIVGSGYGLGGYGEGGYGEGSTVIITTDLHTEWTSYILR